MLFSRETCTGSCPPEEGFRAPPKETGRAERRGGAPRFWEARDESRLPPLPRKGVTARDMRPQSEPCTSVPLFKRAKMPKILEGEAALGAHRDLKRREKSEAGCSDGRARRSPEEKSEPGAFRPKGQEGPRQEGGDSRRKRGRKREKGPPRPRGGPFKGRSTVG